jgi:hypothetical protein
MSTVTITPDVIEVRLSALEKAGALRADLRVPRSAVRSVDVMDDGLGAVRGLRTGLGVPRHRMLGTWRRWRSKEFVDVRRGQPAVRIHLDGHGYDSLLLGVDDPSAVAAALSGA